MTDTLPLIIIPPEWLRGIPDILDWQDKGGRQLPHLEELWPTPTRSAACTFTSLLKPLPYSNKPYFGERKINSGFYYYCGLKTQYLVSFSFHLQPYICIFLCYWIKRVQVTSWRTVILWELLLFLAFLVDWFTSISNVLLYVHCRVIQCNLKLWSIWGSHTWTTWSLHTYFKILFNICDFPWIHIHWIAKYKKHLGLRTLFVLSPTSDQSRRTQLRTSWTPGKNLICVFPFRISNMWTLKNCCQP